MNVAVIGSRTFDDYELLSSTLKRYKIDKIISGGAKGADSLAEQFANENNIPVEIFYPDWNKHGKLAGFIRNNLIIENSDFVIAFWDSKSKGTKHSIELSKKMGKEINVIFI